jgi:hypothetical protein
MTVVAGDMKWYLSGGSGNTNPNASIGGAISTTQVTDNTVDNLFDDVSSAEALAGSVDYRCAYIKNTNGSSTLTDVKIWIDSNTPNANTAYRIGLDPAGVSGTAVAPSPLDEDTPPPGVTFSHSPDPTTSGSGLSIGNMAAGTYQAVWFERTVTAGAASAANDPATFKINGTP